MLGCCKGPKGPNIRDFYSLGEMLGSGSFGEVRRAVHLESGDEVAVKIQEKDAEETMKNEWKVQKELDHPNICRAIDFFEERKLVYGVMELCTGGELFEALSQSSGLGGRKNSLGGGLIGSSGDYASGSPSSLGSPSRVTSPNAEDEGFDEGDAARLVKQMLSAVAFVHARGFVHRDVKAENFVFKDKGEEGRKIWKGTLRLIDFGLATRCDDPHEGLQRWGGSPHYLAPEMYKGVYGQKVDVWAIGILTYLLLTGSYPFDGKSEKQLRKSILKSTPDWNALEGCSPEATEFIQKLLCKDSLDRPSAMQASGLPWLRVNASDRQQRQGSTSKRLGLDILRNARKATMYTRKAVSAYTDERRRELLEHATEKFDRRHGGRRSTISSNAGADKKNESNRTAQVSLSSFSAFSLPWQARSKKRHATAQVGQDGPKTSISNGRGSLQSAALAAVEDMRKMAELGGRSEGDGLEGEEMPPRSTSLPGCLPSRLDVLDLEAQDLSFFMAERFPHCADSKELREPESRPSAVRGELERAAAAAAAETRGGDGSPRGNDGREQKSPPVFARMRTFAADTLPSQRIAPGDNGRVLMGPPTPVASALRVLEVGGLEDAGDATDIPYTHQIASASGPSFGFPGGKGSLKRSAKGAKQRPSPPLQKALGDVEPCEQPIASMEEMNRMARQNSNFRPASKVQGRRPSTLVGQVLASASRLSNELQVSGRASNEPIMAPDGPLRPVQRPPDESPSASRGPSPTTKRRSIRFTIEGEEVGQTLEGAKEAEGGKSGGGGESPEKVGFTRHKAKKVTGWFGTKARGQQ
uniref:Protein kinase domain-containing protein n=1 Tax=Chromera velia CCMP2878 TaxID=1169474 RepID=A0A0G4HY17_9ALVE|eukprot:Cvel_1520.t1-p1 / transcript=Cvel_1520.t1 / gene=Cvel_1520 / organism=Chromera_velia_CCMP2878 / gene_product=Calcium-dependent protein kinase 16, putative / transcript_product=Calcium-dependent protein kinase 16, putative / location=Cvel_scaffold53:128708-137410(+) / protein_length=810 / sequence_SO=supercontig / SO=protein_coding / is_pseudo=false